MGCHDTPVHARATARQLLPCDVTLHRSPPALPCPRRLLQLRPASMAATARRSAGRIAATEAAIPRFRANGPPTRPSCTAAAVAAGLGGRGGRGWPHPVQPLVAARITACRVAPLLAGVVEDQLASGGLHLAHLVGNGAERLPSPVGHTVAPAQEHSDASECHRKIGQQARADSAER